MNPADPPNNPASRRNPDRDRLFRLVFWLVAGVLALLGVFQAWAISWLHDDIFVTLRYVDNWSRGLGLVFNEGERVEGYTHPLWLGLLMAAKALGGDPVAWCVRLGLASYAGVLALAVWMSWRMQPRGFFFVPMTALALVLNFEFRVWATGGLETMFFTMLLLGAFVSWFFTDWPRRFRLALAGAMLTAAMMTRPDGAVIWAMGNAILLGAGLRPPRSESIDRKNWIAGLSIDLLLFNAVFILVFIPWLVWKVGYYGDLLPNTYYTKSGGSWKIGQGLWYVWTFLRTYPSTGLFLIGFPLIIGKYSKKQKSNEPNGKIISAAAAVALLGLALYLGFFVIRVGGDYMFARMVIPALPFAWFTIEWLLIRALRRRPAALAAACVMLPLAILGENLLRDRFMNPERPTLSAYTQLMAANRGVTNEHWYYTTHIFAGSPFNMVQEQRWLGEGLRPFFEGEDVTVLFMAQNIAAYHSRVKTAIGYFGLTDSHIARGASTDTRIGHEKRATPAYLIERGVDFHFIDVPELPVDPWRKAWFQIADQGAPYEGALVTYDKALLERLREKSGGRFTYFKFEDWLDDYIEKTLPTLAPEQARRDYEKFRDYYFRWTPDPAREQRLIRN